jgi:hypothetical protein
MLMEWVGRLFVIVRASLILHFPEINRIINGKIGRDKQHGGRTDGK